MTGGMDSLPIIASYLYATRYGYSAAVLHNDNQIRLFPREGEGQTPIRASLWTLPQGGSVSYSDRFGNRVDRVRVVEHHTSLVVATAGQVRLAGRVDALEDFAIADAGTLFEGLEFTIRSPLVEPQSVAVLAREVANGADSLLDAVGAVTDWVCREIVYKRGSTNVSTTAAQVADAMEGVCQDKTHLALGMLRSLGAPCRYVSGLLTGQVGETHSWVEFLHPGRGWIGADPTRGVVNPPARDYVKLAVGRDYTDVSPVFGSFLSKGGGMECAAIASVRLQEMEPTLDDALELLESAYVVKSDV